MIQEPPIDRPKVEPAKAADYRQVANLFAEVFAEDPVWTALAPHDVSRAKIIRTTFRHALKNGGHEHFDVVRDANGEVLAALNYEPPQSGSAGGELIDRVLGGASWAVSPTMRRSFKHDAAVHSHRPKGPHWYLRDLVVSRQARGMGVGSAVLRSRLQKVDEDGLPAFLESTSEASKRLYERLGFQHLETVEVVPGAKSFIMVRPPINRSPQHS